MVLSDEFDKQSVNGNGADPNLNGVLQQLTNPAAPAANAEDFGRYAVAFASHIDGLFATMPGDVRGLVGPHTIRHMAFHVRRGQFRPVGLLVSFDRIRRRARDAPDR